MSDLDAAVVEISLALREIRVPHMLVGGLAVAAWQIPRATLDVDVCVAVDPARVAEVARALDGRFTLRASDPVGFVSRTSVLPLETATGVRIDCIFARLPYEIRAIERAVVHNFAGEPVPVMPVEDLIYVKFASERAKDTEDATSLLRRHAASLDRAYLKPLLLELAENMANDHLRRIVEESLP